MRSYLVLSFLILVTACGGGPETRPNVSATPSNTNTPAKGAAVPAYTYEIVKRYPHDPKAFTQGLVFHNGFLYEGTGGKAARGDDFFSSLRKVEIESGKVVQKYDVPRDYFGEGITILGDKVYQLTWQERTGFVYDLKDFKLLREFKYSGEGWGLTHDGTNLIMSDGTHVLRILDPEELKTVRTVVVNDEKGAPVMYLNELEYINGEIWANIWQSGNIIRIDPATGNVVGRIDLSPLVSAEMKRNQNADVLNGIAHDPETGRIFVTGKNWLEMIEIKVVAK